MCRVCKWPSEFETTCRYPEDPLVDSVDVIVEASPESLSSGVCAMVTFDIIENSKATKRNTDNSSLCPYNPVAFDVF